MKRTISPTRRGLHIATLSFVITFAAMMASNAEAQTSAVIDGTWRAKDGSSTVVIGPCPTGVDRCATVIAERLDPGQPSNLNQIVVRDIGPDKKRGWRGRYIADGADYKASVKLSGNDAFNFKICAFAFLCETQPFVRLK
jgi:uncharacterized protein (DUF2147 family)